MIRKSKKISFTINPNEIALNQRKFDTSEIGRGIGVHKVKKGKGSYNRKEKCKMNYRREEDGSFFLSNFI
ncbi:MAG: hypothetical protein K0R31_1698 [Clostridiales bacterium]|jgi:hypothetical protein|nr:hypothetical protein [Clostridiales bacterium]